MKHVFVWYLGLDKEIVEHRKKANIRNVVRCSHGKCKRPAAILDHYFPYHDENNRCAKHADGNQFYKVKVGLLSGRPCVTDEFVENVRQEVIKSLGVPKELMK